MDLLEAFAWWSRAPGDRAALACVDAMKLAVVYIGVRQAAHGVHVATVRHPDAGLVRFAFSDPEAARRWYANVPEIVIQKSSGTSTFEVAHLEGVDVLILNPHEEEPLSIHRERIPTVQPA